MNNTFTVPDSEYELPEEGGSEPGGGWEPTSQTFISDVDYNEHGQMVYLAYGNGVTTTYTYDNAGNILTISDDVNTSSQSFTYDELNRLRTAQGYYCDEGSRRCTIEYEYDKISASRTILFKGAVPLWRSPDFESGSLLPLGRVSAPFQTIPVVSPACDCVYGSRFVGSGPKGSYFSGIMWAINS